jgi:hypothetical protein
MMEKAHLSSHQHRLRTHGGKLTLLGGGLALARQLFEVAFVPWFSAFRMVGVMLFRNVYFGDNIGPRMVKWGLYPAF